MSLLDWREHQAAPDVLAPFRSSLKDRYVLEREIGRGSMAIVYLAHDGRRVALKVLRREMTAIVTAERFLREIQIAATLVHRDSVMLRAANQSGPALRFQQADSSQRLTRVQLRQGRVLGRLLVADVGPAARARAAYLWLRLVNDSARVLLVQADTSFEPTAPLIARAAESIGTRHDHPAWRHFKNGPGGMECCIETPTGHIEWCKGLKIRDFMDWAKDLPAGVRLDPPWPAGRGR